MCWNSLFKQMRHRQLIVNVWCGTFIHVQQGAHAIGRNEVVQNKKICSTFRFLGQHAWLSMDVIFVLLTTIRQYKASVEFATLYMKPTHFKKMSTSTSLLVKDKTEVFSVMFAKWNSVDLTNFRLILASYNTVRKAYLNTFAQCYYH